MNGLKNKKSKLYTHTVNVLSFRVTLRYAGVGEFRYVIEHVPSACLRGSTPDANDNVPSFNIAIVEALWF